MDLTSFKEAKTDLTERKTIKADVVKLKEKIARENAKIIKLKVGQDTAYWELKEKLSTTERHHETLQHNMVQLQMEHESVSAQYQEELRRRPEILNKVESTRAICEVLEQNLSRVRGSLQRSAADRAALADAYARAGAAVAAAAAHNEQRLRAAADEARHARERARLSGEHGAQLMEYASSERARAEHAAADAARLRDQLAALREQNAHDDALLQHKEKTIQDLRDELRRVTAEFNERYERSKVTIGELEREVGAAGALQAALAQAETRGEAATRDAARLAAELAAAHATVDEATQRADTLKLEVQELQSCNEKMKEAMQFLIHNGEDLANQLTDKDERIRSLEKSMEDSKQELHMVTEQATILNKERECERYDYEKREAERERELHNYKEQLVTAERELTERANQIENLTRDVVEAKQANVRAEEIIAEKTTELERERNDNEKRATTAESKLTEYVQAVHQLNNDIKVETEKRSKADTALAELTAARERERHEYEQRIESAERKLADLADEMKQVKQQLTVEKEACERANTSLEQMKTERDRERQEFEKHAADTELEIIKRDNDIAHFKSKLAFETEEHSRAKTALQATREELNAARQEANRYLEDICHLKADLRRNDDEAAKKMQTIRSIEAEKETKQNKINELEETIKNIQMITQKGPPVESKPLREPPEHDDNAMATSPSRFRQGDKTMTLPQRPLAPSPLDLFNPPKTKKTNYENANMFSDSSDSMDAGHLFTRNSMRTYNPSPPVSLSTLKRPRVSAAPQKQTLPPPAQAPPVGPKMPQQAPAARAYDGPRKFFKTRRADRMKK